MSTVEGDPPNPTQIAANDLDVPQELSRRRLRTRLLLLALVLVAVVAIVTLLPGLEGLRSRLSHAKPGWLLAGVGLKVLSGLGYIAVFRMVFCRRMSWRVSFEIGMSELGANSLFPTGGAGGLALGAWALIAAECPPMRSRGNSRLLLAHQRRECRRCRPHRSRPCRSMVSRRDGSGVDGPSRGDSRELDSGGVGGRTLRSGPASAPGAHRSEQTIASVDADLADSGRRRRWRQRGGWVAARGQRLADRGIIAYLAFDVMVLWATFRAFGAAPPLAIVWMGYLIGELGGLIPVPGGIGGVDAGLVGTFLLYNVPITVSASAVLAYRAIALWVPAVLGAAAFVALRHTLRHELDEIAVCAPQTEMEVIGLGRVVIDPPRDARAVAPGAG